MFAFGPPDVLHLWSADGINGAANSRDGNHDHVTHLSSSPHPTRYASSPASASSALSGPPASPRVLISAAAAASIEPARVALADYEQSLLLAVTAMGRLLVWDARQNMLVGEFQCHGLRRRKSTTARNPQATWRADGLQFAVCWIGYEDTTVDPSSPKALQSEGRVDIFAVEHLQRPVMSLPPPTWTDPMGAEVPTPRQVLISHVRTIVPSPGVPSTLSLCSYRGWLVRGLADGTVVRCSFSTGDHIDTYRVVAAAEPAAPAITSVAVRQRGRLFGLVAQDGSARVAIIPNAERHGTPDVDGTFRPQATATLRVSDARCVSFSPSRPYIAVGCSESNIELFSYSLGDSGSVLHCFVMRSIASPHSVSGVSLSGAPRSTGGVCAITWCPDVVGDCLAAGYDSGALVVWSSSGAKLVQTSVANSAMPQEAPDQSANSNSSPLPTMPRCTLAWGPHGYRLYASATSSMARTIAAQSLLKSCARFSLRPTAPLRMYLQAPDAITALESQAWDPARLSWSRFPLPKVYMERNWPIVAVAASESGAFVALAGTRGLSVLNVRTRKWRIFGSAKQEQSIACCGLFWLGERTVGVVNYDARSRAHSLLAFPHDHLDTSAVLFECPLTGRPVAADLDRSNEVLVIQYSAHAALYKVSRSRPNARPLGLELVASEILTMPVESSTPSTFPVAVSILPFGATRRAGSSVKFPKVLIAEADGRVVVTDTESGDVYPLAFTRRGGVSQMWSWSFPVVGAGGAGTALGWPSAVQHMVWFVDAEHALHVWVPALDANGDLVGQCGGVPHDPEVYPLGIHPVTGVSVALSAVNGQVIRSVADWVPIVRCSELRTHIRPCFQGLLMWLLRAERSSLARQAVAAAVTRSVGIALIPEALEALLYESLEVAYAAWRNKVRAGPELDLLSSAVSLLGCCPFYTFVAVVMNCARKVDSSRWPVLFRHAGRPEDLFAQCMEVQGEEDGALLHVAAGLLTLMDDQTVDSFELRVNTLMTRCQEAGNLKLRDEVLTWASKFVEVNGSVTVDAEGMLR